MKTKAMIRITVCSLLFLMLLGLMLGGLKLINFFRSEVSGESTVLERKVEAREFSRLEIEWAAGSITIKHGLVTDEIVIREVKDSKNRCTMTTEFDDDTLKISFGDSGWNLGNHTGKDLVILVPSHWNCSQLEISGAALNIDINGLDVDRFELAGAANKLAFKGEIHDISVEGAANVLNISSDKGPGRVNVEGMGCTLDLTLPSNLGFDAALNGLGIGFHSDLEYSKDGNSYVYGNEACKIEISGLGCKLNVSQA